MYIQLILNPAKTRRDLKWLIIPCKGNGAKQSFIQNFVNGFFVINPTLG